METDSSRTHPASAQAEDQKPPESPDDRVGPLSALRYPGFRLLWAAGLFSGGGQQMLRVVNLWLVYDLTNSPLQLGFLGAFQAVPLILFSLVGGALADALNRRMLLLLTQVARIVLVLVLLLLAATDQLLVWHIYAITFFTTAVGVFDRPAQQALLAALVPRSHVTNAIVLNSMAFNMNRMVGPSVAGAVLAMSGAGAAYAINVALFGLALVAYLALRAPAVRERAGRPNMLAMMAEGVTFVTQTSLILALLVLDAFATVFGAYHALMPVFARDVLNVGGAGYGLLFAAPAVGALAGSLVVMFLGNLRRKGVVILVAVFFYALSLVAFGLSPWFWLSLGAGVALGFFDQLAATLRNAVILLITPDELRGRVESIRFMFIAGGPSLGGMQAGAVASLIGAPFTIALGGVVVAIATLGINLRVSQVRQAQV